VPGCAGSIVSFQFIKPLPSSKDACCALYYDDDDDDHHHHHQVNITVSSEIMAILALATSMEDLRKRLGRG